MLYAGVGFFGAAWWGTATESNVMLNQLSTNPWTSLAINAAMLFYLAAGAAACQFPLRTAIDVLLVGEHVPMTLPRAVRDTFGMAGWQAGGMHVSEEARAEVW